MGDEHGALGRGGGLSRGQDPVDPEADEVVQRRFRIAGHVEGAVERDGQGPGRLHERARPLHVHAAVRLEQPQHHAVRAQGAGVGDVAPHDVVFDVRVQEVASPRPDHHEDRDAEARAALGDGARARGGPALDEVVAQLHPAGAPRLGGEGGGHRVHARLDEHAIRGLDHPHIMTIPY